MIFQVALNKPLFQLFDYTYAADIPIGNYVLVPFGKQQIVGIVIAKSQHSRIETDKIRSILKVINQRASIQSVQFAKALASHFFQPIGEFVELLKHQQSKDYQKEIDTIIGRKIVKKEFHLRPEQSQALNQILDNSLNHLCLFGQTGSGKTLVYAKAVKKIIDQQLGNQVLVLVPEIGLINQTKVFLEKITATACFDLHSQKTPKQRNLTIQAVQSGKAKIIIGTRSALFLPFVKLKMIVIDEEHDHSYKQTSQLIYHAMIAARVLAKIWSIPTLAVSASPSLRMLRWVDEKKVKLIHLDYKPKDLVRKIQLVDMYQYGKGQVFSAPAIEALRKVLDQKKQVLVFFKSTWFCYKLPLQSL